MSGILPIGQETERALTIDLLFGVIRDCFPVSAMAPDLLGSRGLPVNLFPQSLLICQLVKVLVCLDDDVSMMMSRAPLSHPFQPKSRVPRTFSAPMLEPSGLVTPGHGGKGSWEKSRDSLAGSNAFTWQCLSAHGISPLNKEAVT